MGEEYTKPDGRTQIVGDLGVSDTHFEVVVGRCATDSPRVKVFELC
jgi:hypothetical protein